MSLIFALLCMTIKPYYHIPTCEPYRAAAARATPGQTITRTIMTFKYGRYESYQRTWHMPGYGGGPVIIFNPYVK